MHIQGLTFGGNSGATQQAMEYQIGAIQADTSGYNSVWSVICNLAI
jgi:hypothetical protein